METAWRISVYGGFLCAREAVQPKNAWTLELDLRPFNEESLFDFLGVPVRAESYPTKEDNA